MKIEGVTADGVQISAVVPARRNEYGEWLVRFRLAGVLQPQMDSFHDDRQDAIDTARLVVTGKKL